MVKKMDFESFKEDYDRQIRGYGKSYDISDLENNHPIYKRDLDTAYAKYESEYLANKDSKRENLFSGAKKGAILLAALGGIALTRNLPATESSTHMNSDRIQLVSEFAEAFSQSEYNTGTESLNEIIQAVNVAIDNAVAEAGINTQGMHVASQWMNVFG